MVNKRGKDPPKLRVRFKEVGTNAAAPELAAFNTAKPVHAKSRQNEYVRVTRASRTYIRREKVSVTETHSREPSARPDTLRMESPQERINVPRVVFTSNPSLVSSMDTTAYQEFLKSVGGHAAGFDITVQQQQVAAKLQEQLRLQNRSLAIGRAAADMAKAVQETLGEGEKRSRAVPSSPLTRYDAHHVVYPMNLRVERKTSIRIPRTFKESTGYKPVPASVSAIRRKFVKRALLDDAELSELVHPDDFSFRSCCSPVSRRSTGGCGAHHATLD